MKKLFRGVLALMLCVGVLSGCGGGGTPAPASAPAAAPSDGGAAQTGVKKQACLITSSPLDNDFTKLIWKGIKQLEGEGWTVKSIETAESGEYADQIRAMAGEGYDVMFIFGDEIGAVAVELSGELQESYPNLHVFMLDTYMEHQTPNCTSIAIDTFESSFVAGYIAAATTEVGKVAWIGHTEMFKITRFRDGFIAGVQYYNKRNNANVAYESAFTGDYNDPVKGYETAISVIDTFGVDVIYQCNYKGGPGVIQACAEKNIKCIGVDDWQGYIDPCVFWSAIKSMDVATYTLATTYQSGTKYGEFFSFDITSGAKVYDERDEKNIPADTLADVKDIMQQIASKSIDIYEGFDEYRP